MNPSVFVDRVWHLPLVAAAVEFTSVQYQQVGESNPVVKSIMTSAQRSILYAAEQSKPVLEGLNKQITVADGLACKTLDMFEKKVPLITKTPEQIAEEAKRLYAENLDLLKNGSTGLLTTVKGFGERQAMLYLQTSYGQRAASTLESLMDKAGWYIDNATIPKGGNYPAQQVSDVQPGQTTQKLLLLTSKIQDLVLLHTQAQLTRLSLVLQMVADMRARSTSAIYVTACNGQEKAVQVYHEMKSRAEREGTVEHALLVTAQQTVTNVVALLKGISDVVKLPPAVESAVSATRDGLLQLQQALANSKMMEIPISLLHQLSQQVTSLQTYLASMISWQSPETKEVRESGPKTKPVEMTKPRKEKRDQHQ